MGQFVDYKENEVFWTWPRFVDYRLKSFATFLDKIRVTKNEKKNHLWTAAWKLDDMCTHTPGTCTIKHYLSLVYLFQSKLMCLSKLEEVMDNR